MVSDHWITAPERADAICASHTLSEREAQEIAQNLIGFFRTLLEWKAATRKEHRVGLKLTCRLTMTDAQWFGCTSSTSSPWAAPCSLEGPRIALTVLGVAPGTATTSTELIAQRQRTSFDDAADPRDLCFPTSELVVAR